MDTLYVLLTNNTLAGRSGSELYVRDVALALKERGHQPIAYSTVLGEVAQELMDAGIEVVDDLADSDCVPDVIHGHHHLETITAMLHFPRTPAIAYCHGILPWEETPLKFPRILRYIAVSHACRDYLVESGIAPEQIRVLLNFVDLKRFRPRPPLPPRPTRALVFCNYASEANYLGAVRTACNQAGIDLAVIGANAGSSHPHPEQVLPQYDLIFAKGRAAIESLAVGAAVITCDLDRLGNLVTTTNFQSFRELNFGFRTLKSPINSAAILKEIEQYKPDDAQEVSRWIRETANREDTIDQLLMIYGEVMQEYSRLTPEWAAEEKAAAAYLRWLSPTVKDRSYLQGRMIFLEEEKNNILNSSSWLITRPLRQTKHLLKQFRKMLSNRN